MITVVSGMPRCGSSLMMKMIHRGGMQVFADNEASYETRHMLSLPKKTDWLQWCEGKAVKLLEPLYYTPPSCLDYRVVWLNRDSMEQAKSAAKLHRVASGMTMTNADIKRLARSIDRDRPKSLKVWHSVGADVFKVDFAELLLSPMAVASRVATHIGTTLDVDAMASCVVRRRPECLPYMLETQSK